MAGRWQRRGGRCIVVVGDGFSGDGADEDGLDVAWGVNGEEVGVEVEVMAEGDEEAFFWGEGSEPAEFDLEAEFWWEGFSWGGGGFHGGVGVGLWFVHPRVIPGSSPGGWWRRGALQDAGQGVGRAGGGLEMADDPFGAVAAERHFEQGEDGAAFPDEGHPAELGLDHRISFHGLVFKPFRQ